MNKNTALLIIAGSVLLTGATLKAMPGEPAGPGCKTSGFCSDVFPGRCVGTAYNSDLNPYCACAFNLNPNSTFGTWQCSPYPPPPEEQQDLGYPSSTSER